MKILIVEDDTVTRRILTRVLKAVGHSVTACPDAETAWDAQAANRHDIVVLDWMLPGMDGLEFCRRLRAEPGGERIVVLVTTSRTSAEDFEQVLAAGADDYLAKPISPELLGVRLRVAEKRVETLRERWAAEDARARLADQIVEAQKLESMAALAGGIAHDFNNMLLAIQGSAELLRQDLANSIDPSEHTGRIETATQRCAQLTGELLAYSGRGRFLARPVNLSEEARSVDAIVREGLDRGRTLRYELATDLPTVEADPEQVRQVIIALLRNAVEALPPDGGDVAVSTGVMDADAHYLAATYGGTNLRPGPYAFVDVADNGVGMDADTLSKVFDPFFSTKSAGRGMGLTAALGIVRGHGGGIHIESAPGQGTDARALLPVSAAPPAEAPVTAPAERVSRPPSTGAAVLVVDDEEAVRAVAGALLESGGFEVFLADGGREAVRVLGEHPQIGLAVVDLMMPGMDGVATLAALRALQPGLRALMSSGYAATEVADRLRASDPEGFLQKPYAPADLIHAVRTLLSD